MVSKNPALCHHLQLKKLKALSKTILQKISQKSTKTILPTNYEVKSFDPKSQSMVYNYNVNI